MGSAGEKRGAVEQETVRDFHHSRLVVYRRAAEFMTVVAQIVPAIPPLYGHLRDQLARAATSITLNIAEGSGEFSKAEKLRFYRMARRSASECAAILETLQIVRFPDPQSLARGLALLHEVIAILTVMSRPRSAARPP